jgi:hypothetical protein
VSQAIRVWRLRKDHTWIEARLQDGGTSEIELQFFYDGALVLARRCPTRDAALATADTYLRDLQRVGWNTHW